MKVAPVALALTILTTAWLGVLAAASNAGELVTVQLDDGTHLTAQVDTRTDDDRLWLRFGGGSVIVRRSFAWNHIAAARHDGRSIDFDTVKSLASEVIRKAPVVREKIEPPRGELSYAAQARTVLGFGHRVSTVNFDAHLANWDGDVEFDGIALWLFPRDAEGRITKVRGTLNVELVAQRKVPFVEVPASGGLTTQRIGQWTISVDPRKVSDDGILVKLPFRTIHPEFDSTWSSHGLLHVRLTVPGQGVFEHSFDALRVRPFAPQRDQRERQGEPRFLPTERTGVSKRATR